jgi:hypothetical protein
LGIVAGKAEFLFFTRQQSLELRIMNRMTNCTFILGKRIVKELLLCLLLQLVVADKAGGDSLRLSDQELLLGSMRVMTEKTLTLLDRRMNDPFEICLFQILVTVKAESRAGFFQNQLLGKTVAFVTSLAVFLLDGPMHEFLVKILLGLLVTVIAILGF